MSAQASPVGTRPGVGTAIAAVLLPPLGIFLARGLGPDFWLGTVLTLIGWIPGIVFALVAVFGGGVLRRA